MYINDIVEEAAETEEVKAREIQRVEYEVEKVFLPFDLTFSKYEIPTWIIRISPVPLVPEPLTSHPWHTVWSPVHEHPNLSLIIPRGERSGVKTGPVRSELSTDYGEYE